MERSGVAFCDTRASQCKSFPRGVDEDRPRTMHNALALLAAGAPEDAVTAYAGPDLTRYLLVSGLLVASIVALGFLFKRVVGNTFKSRAAKRSLVVLDVLPLAGKQRLLVVRCFDRNFLLGAGDKEVRLIAELDRDDALNAAGGPAAQAEPSAQRPPFASLLERTADAPARRAVEERAARRHPELGGGRGLLG